MNNVKKTFSIRDLENLTGIKAHTLRIWEKRYDLLEPDRTETNIRTYSLKSLQKLLNVTLLYNNGYKISKIAKIPEAQMAEHVHAIGIKSRNTSAAINAFKLAMVNFDQGLFQETYEKLESEKSFRVIFWDVFIPLLEELGLLWQTDTIGPAHEHFVTHLIKHKIFLSTEKAKQKGDQEREGVFVLFLPENEIHEIGLLFLNYELVYRGYKTIYLGQTIPLESLIDAKKYFENPHFVSYFTVSPNPEELHSYIASFKETLLDDSGCTLWILGRQTAHLENTELPDAIRIFHRISEMLEAL
jgi:DNA-binding transcriptional MerR regulator